MRVMISTMDQQPTQLTDMLSHAWVICTSKPMLFDWCVDNSKDGLSSPLAPGFAEGLRGVGGSWPLGATNSLEDVWCKTWDCLFQSIITSKQPYKGLHLQRYNGEYIYIYIFIYVRTYIYIIESSAGWESSYITYATWESEINEHQSRTTAHSLTFSVVLQARGGGQLASLWHHAKSNALWFSLAI